MSLRCSLLGHSYGDVEIEREREEQGSEVVVTVREFEECERCGDQNVVSENKEVTALQSPAPDLESAESEADAGADAGESGASAGEAGADAGAGGTTGTTGVADEEVSASDDDAEILTDSPEDSADGSSGGSSGPSSSAKSSSTSGGVSPGASADSGASTDSGASADAEGTSADSAGGDADSPSTGSDGADSPSTADDDGVILDDDASSSDGERRPGEWPAAETTHPSEAEGDEHAPWPDVGREDEGFDAEPGGGSADVEFGGGLTPESAPEVDEDEADEVEFVNAEGDALRARESESSSGGPELSSGISAGAEAPSLSGPADDLDVDAEFVCPECDYRASVAGSSLRAGDICPECGRGYLAQE